MPLTLEQAKTLKPGDKVTIVRNTQVFYVTTHKAWEERRRQKLFVELASKEGTETNFDETRLWAISLYKEEAEQQPEQQLEPEPEQTVVEISLEMPQDGPVVPELKHQTRKTRK